MGGGFSTETCATCPTQTHSRCLKSFGSSVDLGHLSIGNDIGTTMEPMGILWS